MKKEKKSLEERLSDIRNNPIHLTVEDLLAKPSLTSIQREVADFLRSKCGEEVMYPAFTMSTINVSIIRLILLGVFAIACLGLIEYIGVYALLLALIGGTLSGFWMIQKEVAYFDDDKMVDLRSTDLFKRNFKRTEYCFSEIEQVELSFYSVYGSQKAIFKIHGKDHSVFKIDMICSGNRTFVDELSAKLKELKLLKSK